MASCEHTGGHTIAAPWTADGPCRVRCTECDTVYAADGVETYRTPRYLARRWRSPAGHTIVYRFPVPERTK